MTMRIMTAMITCGIVIVHAQYTAEWSSGNLGQYGYGGAYGYDIDSDGLVEYYVRRINQITFYNGDYSVEWSVSVPGYDYVNVISPRDVDGNGIFTPLNTDNDAAGEIIVTAYYYNTGNSTYYGKFRIYDAITRVMEHESAQITGFYGTACQEDIDGDGRDEIILTRFGSTTTSSYVDVYAYTGTAVNDHESYSLVHELTTAPNPSTHGASLCFSIDRHEDHKPVAVTVHDIAGRCIKTIFEAHNGTPGMYELQWNGNDMNDVPVSSGTYFIKVAIGDKIECTQIQIVR